MIWKATTASDARLSLESDCGYWMVNIKYDGCVDIERAHNVRFGDETPENDHMCLRDYLHICDWDDFVEEMGSIKGLAEAHFGKGWK